MATPPEPPPKKRKLLEALNDSSSPSPEIARKSRNKDELRSLFDCYKTIRACVEKKDLRLNLEQSYLSLISSSQGCSSVQRIVAELIPRYVSYCPTAIEAASKVSINMYNWSLSLISKGEDVDKSAYYTAKACIIGLTEICYTASNESSSLDVFKRVFNFFVSSFEGKDIYRIGRDRIEKLQDPVEFLYEMKMESEDDNDEWSNERCLNKLFEIRVLSLFCMFVSSPKNLIEACFGESESLSNEAVYFINQICRDFKGEKERENDDAGTGLAMNDNCFLEMVIKRDSAFKSWIISKQKNLSISEISSLVERVLSSLPESIDEKESEDVPMDLTEESPKNSPLKINNSTENFPTENNQKSKNENISNIPTNNNNNSTQTPQNRIFDFNPTGVSSFIISASKELWISYQNTNASELSLRSKFEEFGQITKFQFYPRKKFAVIEYKNIHDSVKAHSFMQGCSIFGGNLKVKYLDKGLGFNGFTEGLAIGESCFLYVGNVLSQQQRDEILNELSRSGSKLPVSVKDLKSENAVLMEFGSAEEAAVAKARIRLRNSGNDNFAPARAMNVSSQNDYYPAQQQSPMPSSTDTPGPHTPGPHTPGPQVFRPNWPTDPSYPSPSQAPHAWPHRSHPIRPPIVPPPVSPSFRPPYPPTNQISPRVVPPGSFRTPLPFIPSSVTPLSQIPGASLQEKIIPGTSLQNFNRLPPPPVVVPSFAAPAQQVLNGDEIGNNNNKWRGVLTKSGVNYCTIYAVREESEACRYVNGASEPKDWPSKLDVTKRTDLKNVRTTFSNFPASKREVCRLLPTSASDQKGLGDFIAYLKQRECAGVIKIPGAKPMWSRLLFILPHSIETCKMLGINPSPSECLIALVLPKDANSSE
ncbi:hypothetical protein LUZ60_001542 [Juncus effusus]|nr:hypothetical protein LUZ60_001542 [Juncus effusus]